MSQHESSPAARASLAGRLRWALIDRDGREVRAHEQKNLILDQGLNNVAAYNVMSTWMSHVAVGTGSTAPANNQTALVSELARTSRAVSGPTASEVTEGNFEITKTFEFDFDEANGNLTEWGICAASSGQLNTRALFLDEEAEPATITKTEDFKLRLAYTLEVQLAPTVSAPAAHDFDITGLGNIAGVHRFVTGNTHALIVFAAYATGAGILIVDLASVVPGTSGSGNPSASGRLLMTPEAYVPGSYQRTYEDLVVGTSDENNLVSAIVYGVSGTGGAMGYHFILDEPDRFTKDNEHILTLTDPLTITWARA